MVDSNFRFIGGGEREPSLVLESRFMSLGVAIVEWYFAQIGFVGMESVVIQYSTWEGANRQLYAEISHINILRSDSHYKISPNQSV